MLKSLFRLKKFVKPYGGRLSLGISAFGLARLFEATVPMSLAIGIDRIAEGRTDLLLPVGAIFLAVLGRFSVVTFA
ncbi:MAG: hypothetical protein ACC642_06225, partial [Pseudomonadales bacterium]